MAVFDRFVAVDWSASSTPTLGRDSIWIAVRDVGDVRVENVATRAAAEDLLVELLLTEPENRTLIGVDFSLGYPAGTAAALGLLGQAWAEMWALLADLVSDDHRNGNNRFAVAAELNHRITGRAAPFWGCPPALASPTLTTTKPDDSGALPAWREVEVVLRCQGRRPFSSWQLLGAGAVGSQSLLGIPVVGRLRARFAERVEVWPFSTGLRMPDVSAGSVIVAEVWPSLLNVRRSTDTVRDAAQVEAVVNWLADTDAADALARLFSPEIADDAVSAVTAEEGWVLGVTG